MSSPEIDEIKKRLNIAEVIGEYIRLTKAGSNHKALCPFHNEKSPSFMVSEERGSWHCFGCGKGGDVFSFVMELEGIGFREALEQLAGKAGVELKRTMINEQGSRIKDNKKELFKILELATKWYEVNLWQGKGKEKILNYLRGRGLTDQSIKKFRLGYAPDGWRNILDFLTKRGYTVDEINKTGLLVEKSVNSEQRTVNNNIGDDSKNNTDHWSLITDRCYDRFRDRIMFPIQDIMGRVVGYSARVCPGGDEKNAKYVNTAQTALYDKSKILYGLNLSKMEIKKRDESVLVEGNTDVIAAHQAGFGNTVAVSGTALTEEQVKILKRYAENIKMGFDMDAAGQAAARRSIKTCLENDLNVKIVLLSSGKDAAECLKEDPGIWKSAVESAEGVMEYYFKEAFSRYDPQIPADKKKIAQELLNVIKDISNPVEQSHWLKILASRIGTEEKVLVDILQKAKTGEKNHSPSVKAEENIHREKTLGEKILGIILAFPKECRKELAKIDAEDFQNERERAIIQAIKRDQEKFSLERMKALFSDYETRKFLEETVFEAEVRFGGELGDGKDQLDPIGELQGLVQRIKEKRYKEKSLRLTQDIKAAQASGDKAGEKALMEEFQKLIEEKT
ncbi:MAG TPA: DNA primase [Candidatus Bathyarchaeia archaeon]|nr:DNA primase [Candidatus Bathyarchaeia archaeon]